jgi:hypothetical protein
LTEKFLVCEKDRVAMNKMNIENAVLISGCLV